MSRWALLWLVLLAPVLARPGQTLTAEGAVEEAVRADDQLRSAQFRTRSAEDNARSVRGRLLPQLSLSDSWDHYDSPFTIQIGPVGAGAPLPPITARDLNTNLFTLSGEQPLLGLLYRSRDLTASGSSAEANRADEASTQSQLAEQVRTTYIRLFEAKANVNIANASIEQLKKQLEDAKVRLHAGTITNADLLRFQTAVANAQQQVIQASTQVVTSLAGLLTLLGRSPQDDSTEFVEPEDLELHGASAVSASVEELVRQAQASRPEVVRAARQARASRATSQARFLELLPEVNLEGNWTNAQGLPFAMPKNSWYVGVTASWPFFTFGARWYAAQSARGQAEAAGALEEDALRQVALDVSTKFALLKAQFAAVDAAVTAVASAEEAYRVTSVQVAAGTATTTDLLDAHAALTTARLNLVNAQYERAVARVALDRASRGR